MNWISATISPLKDLIAFLYQKGKTNDIHKRQIIRELRNNLIVFENAFINQVPADPVIDNLANEAIKQAVAANFDFDRIKSGKIRPEDIRDERNRKYEGWTAGRLLEKIDEKTETLKTIKRLQGSADQAKNNVSLLLSNLYFRMKMLAEFIQGDKEKA